MNDLEENPLATYETNIEQLEQLITELENGELRLEDALKQYEIGIKLIRQCQHALDTAEQKIQQLSKNHQGEETLIPYTQTTKNKSTEIDEEDFDDNVPF